MYILGISAFYHDSAAVLLHDGEIVAAAQEERYTRQKHDARFPAQAIDYCLEQAGITADELAHIGFYEKPLAKFDRLLESYLASVPAGFESFREALPLWLGKKLFLPREMDQELGLSREIRYVFCDHHESHAASAFFPSPFEEAAIITMDGVGEWTTAALGHGSENRIELTREIRFPHSLGLLYSAFTYYTGFRVNEGEYKVMGLATYGQPVYKDLILSHLIDVKDDGSFWMDMTYFNYVHGLTMTSAKFHDLLGGPPRKADEPLEQRHMDLASSVQAVVEEVMLKAAAYIHHLTGSRNLCLARGVALNCVANGRILREGPFENLWIQPAAGDAGGALGVALLIWHQLVGKPRQTPTPDGQQGSLLGPAYSNSEIKPFLDEVGAAYDELDDDALIEAVSDLLAAGKVVGLFQGRSEYGPRALGCRSIIGDARDPEMQKTMNLKVKFRESFRPFAPIVLRDHAHEYFDVRPDEDSPYMLLVASVREKRRRQLTSEEARRTGIDLLNVCRSEIPAVTHVDYSARVQTVDQQRHLKLWQLMSRFHEKTGAPVLVNTSFNLSWEPIVNRPVEAYRTFMSSDIDALVLESCILHKHRQVSNVKARRGGSSGIEVDPALEEVWACPACEGSLEREGDVARCTRCHESFSKEEGIWRLFAPHEKYDGDVTELVKSFYEETPFPHYDEDESVQSLIDKSRKGVYARLLGDQIPYNARVLEVGCGTGQLSNFLGIGCRTVVGTDMCLNSLRLAEGFRSAQGLNRVRFLQMNLFKPALADARFDVVLCNGVLHHTSDPYGGYKAISRLVRPGGLLVVGLYNTYGRFCHQARGAAFRLTNGRMRSLDPYLRTAKLSRDKQEAWFRDQYQHPHESKHSMGEVLGWFRNNGFDFVNAVPKFKVWDSFDAREMLFEQADPGSAFDRALAQAKMIVTGNREGGFFIVIGRKQATT